MKINYNKLKIVTCLMSLKITNTLTLDDEVELKKVPFLDKNTVRNLKAKKNRKSKKAKVKKNKSKGGNMDELVVEEDPNIDNVALSQDFAADDDVSSDVTFSVSSNEIPWWVLQYPYEVRYFRNNQDGVTLNLMWSDKGSGAVRDISIWRPNLGFVSWDNSLWFSLGDVAGIGYYPPTQVPMIRVREPLVWTDYFKPATSYVPLWNDGGSGADIDGTFFTPICPPGFTRLGDIASPWGIYPPVWSHGACVKQNAVIQASRWLTGQVWDDAGSGAYQDVTLLLLDPTKNIDKPFTYIDKRGLGRHFKVCGGNAVYCAGNPGRREELFSFRVSSVHWNPQPT